MKYEEEIEELRREINRLNEEILDKLAERIEVATRIGAVKRRHGRPVVDQSREERVYDQVRALAREHLMDEEDVVRIFREIIRLSTKVQKEDRP